jgi:Rrf2 family protein
MLRISKKADYAVFLLGCIAREGAYPGGPHEDTVVSAQEIARQAGLNKSVVANLLKGLAREGLLESQRGLKGGYRLTQPPGEISLARVLGVVDGPFHLVDCVRQLGERRSRADDPHACSLISFCATKNPMRVVHQRIAGMFEQIRLDELCGLVPFAAGAQGPTVAPAGASR